MVIPNENNISSVVEDEPSIDLRQYVALFRQWWWLIALASILAGAAAYMVSLRLTPIYESSTILMINDAPSTQTTDYNSLMTNQLLAQTYAQLITTRPVMEKVVERLGLKVSPDYLAGMVTATPVRDTQLMVVKVDSIDPNFSAIVANAVAIVFSEQVQDHQRSRFSASEENLKKQMADAENQVNQIRSALENAPDASEKDRLETRLNQYEQIYASLVVSFEQVRLTEAQTSPSVVQMERAEANPVPVKPKKMQNTLLAAVVGVMLAVGGVFAFDALDDTIRTPEEISRKFQLPVMGTISHFDEPEDGRLITLAAPRSPVTEAFRGIRTNIQYASVDAPLRTLVVTSPTPADGKTTVVTNLAYVMAQGGRSVTVLDADLHRPRVHAIFNVEPQPGLSSLFLRPDTYLNGTYQSTLLESLHVVTAGKTPPNPSELLGSNKMREILNQVLSKSDFVLIDTPPVLSLTDALVLAPVVDGVMLVIKPGVTKETQFKQALEQLRYVGAHVIGVVINGVDVRNRRYGYYYRYYKSYDYRPYSATRRVKKAVNHLWGKKVERHAVGREVEKSNN